MRGNRLQNTERLLPCTIIVLLHISIFLGTGTLVEHRFLNFTFQVRILPVAFLNRLRYVFLGTFYAIRIFDTTHPPPTTHHTISGTDPRGKAKKSAKITKCLRDCSNQRDPLERVQRYLSFGEYVLRFPRQGKTKKSETNIRRKRALKLKGPLGEGSKESLLFMILPHYNP